MDQPSETQLNIPSGTSTTEQVIRRSRFIGCAFSVESIDDVRDHLGRLKAEHSAATHVAYAYLIGPIRSQTAGTSDDGEPKGTAGRPILEMIRGHAVTNALVAVVRYFGGTKLGAGGLARAYGDCARQTLDRLPVVPYVIRLGFLVVVPYGLHDAILRELNSRGANIIDEKFGSEVEIRGNLPEAEWDACSAAVADMSRGSISLRADGVGR